MVLPPIHNLKLLLPPFLFSPMLGRSSLPPLLFSPLLRRSLYPDSPELFSSACLAGALLLWLYLAEQTVDPPGRRGWVRPWRWWASGRAPSRHNVAASALASASASRPLTDHGVSLSCSVVHRSHSRWRQRQARVVPVLHRHRHARPRRSFPIRNQTPACKVIFREASRVTFPIVLTTQTI